MVPGRLQASLAGNYDCRVSARELPTLLLRADAGPRIGAGHVMRCLALGEAWQDRGGRVAHLGDLDLPGLERRLGESGVERVSEGVAAEWVALDGYAFEAGLQRSLRAGGGRTLVLDDTSHLPEYHADLLLNQNLHARNSMYEGKTSAALLLGTRYALLRREFWDLATEEREPPARPSRLLLTLGGSGEVAPLAQRLAESLATAVAGAELTIIGGAAQGRRTGANDAERDCRRVASRMVETDLAVSAAGSTCWELARCGVPMVLIALADNQRPVGRSLAEAGAARYLGGWEDVPPERVREEVAALAADRVAREAMARAGRALVDAEGGRRVVMRMRGDRIRLRDARRGDMRLLLEWANDPGVRAASFSSAPIEPEQHRRWFEGRLADSRCAIFIAVDELDAPVGQIRFECTEEGIAVVGVSVAPQARGGGLGNDLIARGVERLTGRCEVRRVDAFVKVENQPSHRAFEKAGFSLADECEVRGVPALRWTRSTA